MQLSRNSASGDYENAVSGWMGRMGGLDGHSPSLVIDEVNFPGSLFYVFFFYKIFLQKFDIIKLFLNYQFNFQIIILDLVRYGRYFPPNTCKFNSGPRIRGIFSLFCLFLLVCLGLPLVKAPPGSHPYFD